MIKVSVIIPCFAGVKIESIQISIDSLLRQTMSDMEILCIFEEKHLARKMAQVVVVNDKIRIEIENVNSCHMIDFGVKLARGDYIGFVLPGDEVERTMYEKLYRIVSLSLADIVRCDYWMCEQRRHNLVKEHSYLLREEKSKMYDKLLIEENASFATEDRFYPSGIYRRLYILENGIRHCDGMKDSNWTCAFDFQLKMAADSIWYKGEALYNHYKQDESYENENVGDIHRDFCFLWDTIYNSEMRRRNMLLRLWFEQRLTDDRKLSKIIIEDDLKLLLHNIREDASKVMDSDGLEINYIDSKSYYYLFRIRMTEQPFRSDDIDDAAFMMGQITSLLRARRIFIYGAGQIGQRVLNTLKYLGLISKLHAVLVTDKSQELRDFMDGVQIKEFMTYISNIGTNDIVIVGVGYKLRGAVVDELIRSGIENYIYIKPAF